MLRQDYKENDELNEGDAGAEKEGDGTQVRAYINNVTIKILTSDIFKKAGDKKNLVYTEQKFRVTKQTTWKDMLDEAKLFWGLNDGEEKLREEDRTQFTLVLPNHHDVMSLNGDSAHVAHTLAKYFEIHRAKRATLIL